MGWHSMKWYQTWEHHWYHGYLFGGVQSYFVDSYIRNPTRKLPTTTWTPAWCGTKPIDPIASSNTPKVAAGTSWIFAWFRSPDNAWKFLEIFGLVIFFGVCVPFFCGFLCGEMFWGRFCFGMFLPWYLCFLFLFFVGGRFNCFKCFLFSVFQFA